MGGFMDYKKGYIIFSVIASIVLAWLYLWYVEYPGKGNFYCNKNQNICKISHKNVFNHEFSQNIPLNLIFNAHLYEKFSRKEQVRRYSSRRYDGYNYYFYLDYNNNGKVDTFPVYVSSDFEYNPADESYDDEYRYYKEGVADFNIFLKEDKLTIYEFPEYVNKYKQSDYWRDLLLWGTLACCLLFGIVIPILCILLNSRFIKFEKLVFNEY